MDILGARRPRQSWTVYETVCQTRDPRFATQPRDSAPLVEINAARSAGGALCDEFLCACLTLNRISRQEVIRSKCKFPLRSYWSLVRGWCLHAKLAKQLQAPSEREAAPKKSHTKREKQGALEFESQSNHIFLLPRLASTGIAAVLASAGDLRAHTILRQCSNDGARPPPGRNMLEADAFDARTRFNARVVRIRS